MRDKKAGRVDSAALEEQWPHSLVPARGSLENPRQEDPAPTFQETGWLDLGLEGMNLPGVGGKHDWKIQQN